jgi:hypothetical protein
VMLAYRKEHDLGPPYHDQPLHGRLSKRNAPVNICDRSALKFGINSSKQYLEVFSGQTSRYA